MALAGYKIENQMKRFKLNTSTSIILQIVTILTGLIIPKFILMYFGSEINGLVSSITQYLSFISLLELGVGAVVQSSLYRPIADKNQVLINKILSSANIFFNRMARILVVYVVVLILIFPHIVDSPLNYFDTSFLIFAMSISLFSQYYFGIVNQIFLNSHQLNYIHVRAQIFSLILNTVFSIVLMVSGFSIQVVRLSTSIIFLIKPIYMRWYVNKHFETDLSLDVKNENFIPQKWNGMLQHISYTVTTSTDVMVLSTFSSLANASVYSVHNLVTLGLKQLVSSLTNGMNPLFGTLIAEKKHKELENNFARIEWVLHNAVSFIFGVCSVMLSSFVLIYTKNITDANYNVPLFAFLITLSQVFYCIRLPYNAMILAAGHFKETQMSALIEVILNVVISIVLVSNFGLIGVSIGTIVSLAYRTVYQVYYLKKNIISRSVAHFWKLVFVDFISITFINAIHYLLNIEVSNLLMWVVYAAVISLSYLVFMLAVNFVLYRSQVIKMLQRFRIIRS